MDGRCESLFIYPWFLELYVQDVCYVIIGLTRGKTLLFFQGEHLNQDASTWSNKIN